jgi:hypothetical protein
MRAGAWLVVVVSLGLLPSACSGGYPLAPTRCDDWCHVTHGNSCGDSYRPAECVSSCESARLDTPECRAQLDAVISCYASTPNAAQAPCRLEYSPSLVALPCAAEQEALAGCRAALNLPFAG